MKRIALNILIVLLTLCFVETKSFAFDNPWKNANPKCKRYDFRCKRLSPKMTVEEVKKKYGKRSAVYKQAARWAKEDDADSTEINLYTGLFDYSDHNAKGGLIGVQHQNEELFRESFLGTLSPITGGFVTDVGAIYLYTGAQAEYDLGLFKITPSFAPGYYHSGSDGKDLGHKLEFKTELQMSLNLNDTNEFGLSYNHISNASLGTKNPGANSILLNYLKHF